MAVETMLDFVDSTPILSDAEGLLRRMNRDGYLFFRGLLPREEVLELRRQFLTYCQEEGWLRPGAPLMDGLTDHEPVLEGEPAWKPVYAKIQRNELFHKIRQHANVKRVADAIFGERTLCLPMNIARVAFPRDNKRATQPHQDWIYVRGSMNTISCWAPVGDVPAEVGGLKILVESHKQGYLVPRRAEGPGGNTVDFDPGLRWAATDYRAGDVLMFLPLTVHGARDNQTSDHLRISIDFRYTGVSHYISDSWLKPHFHWLGSPFNWDELDRDWKDQSLRRYWERIPNLRVITPDNRIFNNV